MKRIRACVRMIMPAVFFSLLCFLLLPRTASASSVRFYNGHRYKAYEKCMTWDDAKEMCEKAGGHLITITSKGEQKFVASLIKKEKRDLFWIGLYESGSQKKWVTGEDVTYLNIECDQSGQYVYGMYSRKAGNQWYDHDNILRDDFWDYTRTSYICEWDTTPLRYTDISLGKSVYYYNGKSHKPSVKVTLAGKTLKKGRDYTVTYSANKNVGTASVTIKGKGCYTGTVKKTFSIKKASVKLGAEKLTLRKGNSAVLTAVVRGNSQKITWTSSNKKIASVSKNGVVKARKKGTVYITASANGQSARCKITVK